MPRTFPRPIKRVVVKLGSSLIATYRFKPHRTGLRRLVKQVDALRRRGIDVVLVSSGAIVLGLGALNERVRPSDVASLQAAAAIGQTALMNVYSELFKKCGRTCAQILLTWDDFDDRQRFNNARSTLLKILERGVIPVINENDTIATDEIKFGDNDRLSALVASLIHADLLVILSDVEGLYDLNSEDKKIFQEVKEITAEIEGVAGGTGKKNMSKGGMKAKLEAVRIATHADVPCVITGGHLPDILLRIVSGERVGTLFLEKEDKLLSHKHWIAFGAKPKGVIIVDDGAKAALLKGGRSLLLVGIVRWEGNFKAGDVVTVCDVNRQEIGRGVCNYSDGDLVKIENRTGKQEAIHYDHLVLNQR